MTRARLRSLGAWIALAAALVLALAPTVSRAMQSGPSLPAEVCTIDGIKVVHDGTGDAPGTPASKAHLDHCALCPLAAGGALPPATTDVALERSPAERLVPARFLAAPRTQPVWSPAAPRGPPARA